MEQIMQHMGNAKKHIYTYMSIVFVICYLIYLFYDFLYTTNPISFINSKKNDIELFLIKNKRIDAIIVGGSQAEYGISAEDLSKFSNKYFYNFSVSSEMNDHFNYMKYLKLTTPDSIRNKVRLIVYSSIKLYSGDIKITGSQKIKIIPSVSILSRLYNEYRSHESNYLKNNYKKYGDLANYPLVDNTYLNDFKFKQTPLSQMIEFIVFKKKQLSLLYPNAKIVVTAPPFYSKTPNYQNNYILKLSQELDKRDIYFFAEQANSNKQIWYDNAHLNKVGRKIRSKELFNMLDSILNHNLFN
jgi:hypothetical protein